MDALRSGPKSRIVGSDTVGMGMESNIYARKAAKAASVFTGGAYFGLQVLEMLDNLANETVNHQLDR